MKTCPRCGNGFVGFEEHCQPCRRALAHGGGRGEEEAVQAQSSSEALSEDNGGGSGGVAVAESGATEGVEKVPEKPKRSKGPSTPASKRQARWRERHPEEYRARNREYQRRRRAALRGESGDGPDL